MTDPRYGWPLHCEEHFGAAPTKILHEWNTVAHVSEYEGDPRRRPLTYDEVQALFDAAESLVEAIRTRGRKGALAAQRDAVLLKTIYAFGLRRREAWGLDLTDLRHNPRVSDFGRVGGSSSGGANLPRAANPSAGRSISCRRWTGWSRSWSSGWTS